MPSSQGTVLILAFLVPFYLTANHLSSRIRNICLVLSSPCTQEDLINAWKHECENVYGNVLVNKVDKERWMQTLYTSARKHLKKYQVNLCF